MMADTPTYQWPPVRRKKPVSKWKRFLHKYWPPIRFGLIILAFIGLIWLIIALIVSCGRKDKAYELASELPHIRESRETILPMISQDLNDDEINENIKTILLGI